MVVTSSSDLKRVPAALLTLGRFLGLDPLHPCCSFKPQLFLCAPGHPGLVWARCPGLTGVAGSLFYPDPAPSSAIKVEGECKPWRLPVLLTQREFQQFCCHLAEF